MWTSYIKVYPRSDKQLETELNQIYALSKSLAGYLELVNVVSVFVKTAVSEWVSSVLRSHQHSIGYMGDGSKQQEVGYRRHSVILLYIQLITPTVGPIERRPQGHRFTKCEIIFEKGALRSIGR